MHQDILTDLSIIAANAAQREEENEHFVSFVHHLDGRTLDAIVHQLNDEISAQIDCTQCGNCCGTLMINVTPKEVEGLADFMDLAVHEVKERYIEESLAGNCIINTIPCSFLKDKKCTIYAGRFLECREFPHLHKDGFKERLLGTLLHYGSCPIIYNVVEAVKQASSFFVEEDATVPQDL